MTIIFECSLSAVPHFFDSTRMDQWRSCEIPGGATIQVGTSFARLGDSRSPRIYASLVPVLITFGTTVAGRLLALGFTRS